MAWINSSTLVTARRRSCRSVSSLKNRSTRLSHDAEVGVISPMTVEPLFHLGMFVGGVVVEDDVDVEILALRPLPAPRGDFSWVNVPARPRLSPPHRGGSGTTRTSRIHEGGVGGQLTRWGRSPSFQMRAIVLETGAISPYSNGCRGPRAASFVSCGVPSSSATFDRRGPQARRLPIQPERNGRHHKWEPESPAADPSTMRARSTTRCRAGSDQRSYSGRTRMGSCHTIPHSPTL